MAPGHIVDCSGRRLGTVAARGTAAVVAAVLGDRIVQVEEIVHTAIVVLVLVLAGEEGNAGCSLVELLRIRQGRCSELLVRMAVDELAARELSQAVVGIDHTCLDQCCMDLMHCVDLLVVRTVAEAGLVRIDPARTAAEVVEGCVRRTEAVRNFVAQAPGYDLHIAVDHVVVRCAAAVAQEDGRSHSEERSLQASRSVSQAVGMRLGVRCRCMCHPVNQNASSHTDYHS